MISYQNHLEEMKLLIGESETVKTSKKFTFLTDDLKILSYKQTSNNNVVEKKDKDDKIEINKLIKFAKSGSKNGRLLNDNLSNFSKTQTEKKYIELMKEIPKEEFSSTPLERGDTIKIVKNEILNSIHVNDIIQQKRMALEECMKEYELPKMEDYEKILMRNITTQKISQHTSVIPKNKDEINYDKKTKEFPDLLKEKYNSKKVQWKVEDIQTENLEKLEKERRKETKTFLNQINKRPRFAQQYIDHYSQRDQKINNNIVDINKALGKQFYDKKKLNKKIDEFIIDMEIKNKEDEENLKLSIKEKPVNSNNDEIRKLLNKNLLNEDDDREIRFGERENEIVQALVNSTRDEKSHSAKNRELYNEFKTFKEKIVSQEKAKLSLSPDHKSKKKVMFQRLDSKIKNVSSSNFLRESSHEIINHLRRSSSIMSSKELTTKFALFKRKSQTGINIIKYS